MAGVRVDVIQSSLKYAEDALESAAFNKWEKHAHEIGEIFIEVCTPFVPLKTGRLIDSGHVVNSSKEGIHVAWNASRKGFDYARRQYYNSEYEHPLQGTDHWDQEAMAVDGDVFVARCEEELN